jgi:hypothetical protein
MRFAHQSKDIEYGSTLDPVTKLIDELEDCVRGETPLHPVVVSFNCDILFYGIFLC